MIRRAAIATGMAFLLLGAAPLLFGAAPRTLVEDSFADFVDGTLDASGQNLYVSRDGRVRAIHRFDLNQDGWIDLLFNSTHDTRNFVAATLGTAETEQETRSTRLPVQGSSRVALGDLNRDGWLDAVFCPNDSGLQHPRRFVTLAYGGAAGWNPRRLNGMLPTQAAVDVAIADLNADRWPDIAVLNGPAWRPGQPEGSIARVYWGSAAGYLLSRYQDFGVPEAVALAASDFDQDGARDLAVLRASGRIRILWSGETGKEPTPTETRTSMAGGRCLTAGDVNGDGRADLVVGTGADTVVVLPAAPSRRWREPLNVPAHPATQVAIGDLDGDRVPDLVLTNFELSRALGGEAAGAADPDHDAVQILWGGADGYSRDRALALPVRQAAAAAIGDLDGDGLADLTIAIHQGQLSYTAESVYYRGARDRQLRLASKGFETEGAIHVTYAPAERTVPARVLFANSVGGTLREEVPLQLYWGGKEGFSPARRVDIPFRSGYESTCADFNRDGFPDLLSLNSQHAGAAARNDPQRGVNLFWGGATGFDFTRRRTVLPESNLGTSNTADLDRDGYLDLVLGAFDAPAGTGPTKVIVRYGNAQGFGRRVEIQCDGRSTGSCIADFNGDGWLDIAATSTYKDLVRIFWGSPDGFDPEKQAQLEVPYAISLESADLNNDGRLDLVVGAYHDTNTREHDPGIAIFWGSNTGFHNWDSQRLPAWAPVGPCVADWDRDGYLDLFVPNYLGETMRGGVPSYLYWGGKDGFDPNRRTSLTTDSAHDALAADFDKDGRLDLAISCHSKDGDHRTDSRVVYGDGRRFANPRVALLPTHGTHWMWDQDMGHAYDRKWRQTYTSSVLPFDGTATAGTLRSVADLPTGTRLTFQVRSGPTDLALGRAAWRSLRSGEFTLNPGDRRLQYRAEFVSDNGDRYPVLDRVEVVVR